MEKDAPLACRQELIDLASLLFSSVIIIPEDFSEGEIPFWVRPVEIGDVLCFKVAEPARSQAIGPEACYGFVPLGRVHRHFSYSCLSPLPSNLNRAARFFLGRIA